MVESVIAKKLQEFFEGLEKQYAATGFGISFGKFVGIFFCIALLVLLVLLALKQPLAVSVVAFLTVLSMVGAIPIAARESRIEAIESNLPDALKHMALILKAGGTTETALEEVSQADYGPLTEDLKGSLKQLKEGKSFDAVLFEVAQKSGSILFERTVLIVMDAKRAGAGLADIMFSIAEDARDVLHIKRERRSRTTMHVMFMFVSGIIISPFIFGFSISIVNYINQGIASAMPNAQPSNELCTLNLVLTLFIAAQTLIAVLAIGLIREGRFTKFLMYAPILVLAALIIFEIGKFASTLIVGGTGVTC
ncbi:type II secretion system F family protein [Candidatus Micrarchaeota archaeon]|nr:type II secretion system F family protein [Candidatus Micrarchaeota archaeon]